MRLRKLAAIGTAGALAAGTGIVLMAGPAQASASYGYSGFSHGTYVFTGLVNSGPQVSSFFGCTKKTGFYRDNTAASVNLNGQALAGSVETKTYTHNDARGDGTTSYATAATIKIGPLLEIAGARTFSRAVRRNGRFETSAWTRYASLKVAGVPLPGLLNPAPNTKLDVPGLGYVVLNRVVYENTSAAASASSSAVLIHSTVQNPYLPQGATVAVLHTKAVVGGNRIGLLRGNAFTVKATAGGVLKAGPVSYQTTCMGTGGQVRTIDVAGVTVPGAAVVNGLSTSQAGVIRSDLISGWMSARVAGVNLGNGQVKLSTIAARAVATKTAAGQYPTAVSSSVGSLVIAGKAVPVPQLPNQRIDVAGLGSLTFNKQVKKTGYVSVTAVEIRLTALNTVIEIAHAEAGIVS